MARAQETAAAVQQISSAPMGSDSRLVLTGLLQSQAQLASAKARLSQTRLVAPQESIVLTRSVEPGQVAQPSRTLLVLAAGGDTQLVFQADERNLAALGLGQKARAAADAYPQQTFDAVVSYIAPSIDPQRGSVEVRLKAPQAPSFLKPDMTVSVDLTVAAKAQALTLPSEAVHDAATAAPWAFAIERKHLVKRPLQLGLRGEGTVEILSGIEPGGLVILPDGQALSVGQRVRAER